MTDSKKTPEAKQTPPPTVAAEAAAKVAEAQPQPKQPAPAPPKLPPTLAAMTPAQLRAGAKRAEKSGDKATAATLNAAAKLAEQQVTQKKQEKEHAGKAIVDIIAFMQAKLTEAFGSGTLQTPPAPFTCRVTDEPPFVVKTSRDRKTGQGDDRPAVNAKDLASAGVDAFLMPDGTDCPAVNVNNKPAPAHPATFLNAFAPDSICYYDRACRIPEHEEKLRADNKLTDAQEQGIKENRGLRHGDSAARAFATLAQTDTAHNVRMTDGNVKPVKEVVAGILTATAS